MGADVAHMCEWVHMCAQGVAVRFIPSSLVNVDSYFARGLHVFLECPLRVRQWEVLEMKEAADSLSELILCSRRELPSKPAGSCQLVRNAVGTVKQRRDQKRAWQGHYLGFPQGLGASLIRKVTLESTRKEPRKEGQPIEPV